MAALGCASRVTHQKKMLRRNLKLVRRPSSRLYTVAFEFTWATFGDNLKNVCSCSCLK